MISSFFRDLIRYIPSKVVPGLFAILVIPIVTRLLDPGEYGKYILILNTTAFLGIIGVDWVSMSLPRFFPDYEKRGEAGAFWGTTLRVAGVTLGGMGAALLLAALVLPGETASALRGNLLVAAGIFLFGTFYNLLLMTLVVQRKAGLYSTFHVWRQCACILLGLALVAAFGLGAEGLLWGILLGVVGMLPVLYFVALRRVPHSGYSPTLLKGFFAYGIPLVASNLSCWVLDLSDRYIIGIFRGAAEVGLYSVSYNISNNTIQLVVTLVALASGPVVMRVWEHKGPEATRAFVKDLFRAYLIMAVPATVGLSLLARPIVSALTSPAFHPGARIIPLVAASIFLFGVQRNFQLALLFHMKTRLIMYCLIGAGALNLLLNLWLVPLYGYIAAGYTTLVAYMALTATVIVISRRYFTWPFPVASAARVAGAALVMGVAVWSLLRVPGLSSMTQILLCLLIGPPLYLLALFAFGELKRGSFEGLKEAFGKANGSDRDDFR